MPEIAVRDVSIVVPAYAEEQRIGRTVAGLLGQQGAAAAGGALGRAAPFVQLAGLPMQLAAFQAGRGGSGFGSLFGGSPAGAGVVSSAPGLRMPSGGGFSLMTPGGG